MKNRTKRILLVALVLIACAVFSELIAPQPVLNKGVVIGMGAGETGGLPSMGSHRVGHN